MTLGAPLAAFAGCYAEAEAKLGADAEVMALATADARARPSVRMVLYRGLSGGGASCPGLRTSLPPPGERVNHRRARAITGVLEAHGPAGRSECA